jgi:hypothetical protein
VELSPPLQTSLSSSPLPTPNKRRSRPLPIIQDVSKKYYGIRGLFTRTYQLEDIIVTRTLVSPYLFAGKGRHTNDRKAILKLILVVMNDYQFTFAFPHNHHAPPRPPPYPAEIADSVIQQQLATWISYQPLLPLLVHAIHIYRVGIKLYIVYNIQ